MIIELSRKMVIICSQLADNLYRIIKNSMHVIKIAVIQWKSSLQNTFEQIILESIHSNIYGWLRVFVCVLPHNSRMLPPIFKILSLLEKYTPPDGYRLQIIPESLLVNWLYSWDKGLKTENFYKSNYLTISKIQAASNKQHNSITITGIEWVGTHTINSMVNGIRWRSKFSLSWTIYR